MNRWSTAVRPLALVALGCAAALALAACGSKTDVLSPSHLRPFTVELDFFPNADHAALYSALDNGDFRRAGLDVRPQTPTDPALPLKLLAAGRVDMAISYEPELLLARDQGLPLVAIGALVNRPLTSIIAIGKQHIRTVADLRGKTVGTAGIPYQSAMLKTILQTAGVAPASVHETNVGFNLVPAMISGKVAATLGGYWNYEAIQLSQAGKAPTVIHVDRAGVPSYDELVLVVRAQEAHSDGLQLRAFMQALSRGAREVQANQHQAVSDLLKANASLDGRLQATSVRETLPAELPAAGQPYGYMDPAAWRSFGTWMLGRGLLTHAPQPTLAMTNEFLPGEGVPITGSAQPDSGGP